MSITARLIVVIVAVLAPALAAAVWGVMQAHDAQRELAEQNLRQLAHALASVVDQELEQRAGVLQTLARSPALQRGDLKQFYLYARAMAPTLERTIVLSDAQGTQLMNTRLPLGSPRLPASRTLPELRERLELAPDATAVSDLYFAPIGKRHSFAVQVPVVKDGAVTHYLSMGSYGETLQKLLFDQRLQPGWNASILDRNGRLVARRIDPERYVGKPATPDMIAHLRARREGLFETVRLDGVATWTGYAPIGDTGWTYVVSMPRAALQADLTRALAVASLIALALIGLGLAVAIAAGRSIAAAFGRANAELRSMNRSLEQRVDAAVSQAKRAQEALLHNQKLEALGRLTGGIAHDFNNLLQTLSVSMEIVLRNAEVPAVRTAAEAGKRAVQNAVKLTSQLMAFGRNQAAAAETLDLRDQAMRLQDLIVGALRRDIELAFDFPGELWPVTVDEVQLELALLNASLNARDAMPKGGRLVIGARNVAVGEGELAGLAAGEYVRLTVADNGHGIPAELLPRVFEPFFTTKDVGKGSGLGLAQIYGFAVQSGGTATVSSATDGSGTALSLWLPRARGDARPEAGAAGRPADAPRASGSVLFVEDDALVQAVVAPALEHAGFRVVLAGDAEAALRALEGSATRIDAVFSDIVMPGGQSGVELAVELQRRRPGLPVLLATGYADVPAIPEGVRVLRKPYLLEELAEALAQALREKPGG